MTLINEKVNDKFYLSDNSALNGLMVYYQNNISSFPLSFYLVDWSVFYDKSTCQHLRPVLHAYKKSSNIFAE